MSESKRIDILGLTSEAFVEAAAMRGVSKDAALEIYRRVFREGAHGPDWVELPAMERGETQRDGEAIKFTLRMDDGLETESVILPQMSRTGRPRNALCVSSQVGCAMGCTFCETAQMGLMKSLTAAEIVGQWRAAAFEMASPIDNVVFMGMGEPMDNVEAVIAAIRVFADRNGPAISPSRISVSTVGHAEGIARYGELAREEGFHGLGLAVSINAPNDAIRSEIMPISRATPMTELMEAMLAWPPRDRTRILIEYVVIPGVNDALEHADGLCAYLEPLRCTVNVIPYNPRRDSPWPAPSEEQVDRFVERIESQGQFVKRRRTMGRSAMAACGQLGNPRIRRRRFIEVDAAPGG